MKFIAHRGNTVGPQPSFENRIHYIEEARADGHAVEIDLQLVEGVLYLGHDDPQECFPLEWAESDDFFCHAKTPDTFGELLRLGAHTFYHENDAVTLTSRQLIWCFPGVHTVDTRAVWLDLHDKPVPENLSGIYGVCGDRYKEIYFR